MVLDKHKLEFQLKISFIVFWFLFFLVNNSFISAYLPLKKFEDHSVKKVLVKKVNIALLGGSNVLYGLSAHLISANFAPCINLGLVQEMGAFAYYKDWLSNGFKARLVVYSPAILWSTASNFREVTSVKKVNFYFPSIISQAKAGFILLFGSHSLYNEYGDGDEFVGGGLTDYFIDSTKFAHSTDSIVLALANRIKIIKDISGSKFVLIRIPPVFAKSDVAKSLKQLMATRISKLQSAGVTVVKTTIVTSDAELFNDNFHPSKHGIKHFTIELIKELSSMKNLDFIHHFN